MEITSTFAVIVISFSMTFRSACQWPGKGAKQHAASNPWVFLLEGQPIPKKTVSLSGTTLSELQVPEIGISFAKFLEPYGGVVLPTNSQDSDNLQAPHASDHQSKVSLSDCDDIAREDRRINPLLL